MQKLSALFPSLVSSSGPEHGPIVAQRLSETRMQTLPIPQPSAADSQEIFRRAALQKVSVEIASKNDPRLPTAADWWALCDLLVTINHQRGVRWAQQEAMAADHLERVTSPRSVPGEVEAERGETDFLDILHDAMKNELGLVLVHSKIRATTSSQIDNPHRIDHIEPV